MGRRELINVKTGVILPWNKHLAAHPDMVDHVPEPPKAAKKPAKTRKKLSLPKKPTDSVGDVDIDDLIGGLD